MKLYDNLEQRGFIDQITDPQLADLLNAGGMSFYVGFDPTADSLHVGQLAVFNLMRFLQKGGHTPIGLMGGATGMIGDPSGKDAERTLLTPEQMAHNIAAMRQQIERFLDFESGNKAIFANNYDWTAPWSFIDFLREFGKNFSVNQMMARDSVRTRLEGEAGITYTEFSYVLLQAFDFLQLYQDYGCTLQLGGSDQWGNIVSGIDLIRRKAQAKAYGLTMPLVTKSDGTKFGKSASNAVWLSAEKTLPYEFYQFFLRQDDADVSKLLRLLTDIPLERIAELEDSMHSEPHLRKAQQALAKHLTRLVHGEETLAKCMAASKALFGGDLRAIDEATLLAIFRDVPCVALPATVLEGGYPLLDALAASPLCSSKSEAARLVESGGVYVNNTQEKDKTRLLLIGDKITSQNILLRVGKKNYAFLEFT